MSSSRLNTVLTGTSNSLAISTVLCASDPYAVVGVEKALGLKPDLVTGPATSTSAAIDLVAKLSDVEALNVMEPDSLPVLRKMLQEKLCLRTGAAEP